MALSISTAITKTISPVRPNDFATCPSMNTMSFELRGEHVALCDLLKLAGIAVSGGQGKLLIANGEVTVDGLPEARKTAKIRANQTVECRGRQILVLALATQKKTKAPLT